jgi:predicted ester cyclase
VLTNFSETIEDIFAEGDRVCLRYTERGTFGVSAWGIEKGKSYEKPGITIYRMENGQMAELWWQEDLLGWAHQLGVKDIYAFFQELGFKE